METIPQASASATSDTASNGNCGCKQKLSTAPPCIDFTGESKNMELIGAMQSETEITQKLKQKEFF